MAFGDQVRDYHAQVTAIDREIGRLLARLDGLGIGDDTLVVYTSDHGEMLGSQGRLRKCVFYRESTQVPLLLRHRELLQAGSVCEELIAGIDLPATLLGLCGIAVPPQMDGLDLSGHLRGEKTDARRRGVPHAMIARGDPRARDARLALRTRDRLYIAGEQEELDATKTDPWEQRNLADDPARAEDLVACRRLLREELWA